MKSFRIKYTKTIEGIAEIEAETAADAWKIIKSDKLSSDRRVVWSKEGDLEYKAETTEEIVMNIASNPS